MSWAKRQKKPNVKVVPTLDDVRFIAYSDACGDDADDIKSQSWDASREISIGTSHLSRVATRTELFETVVTVKDSKHGADFTMNTIRLRA